MIGWIVKKINGEVSQTNGQIISHYYDSEKSLCKEIDLISATVDEYQCNNFYNQCPICKKMSNSKIAIGIRKKRNEYDKKRKEFIKNNNVTPEKIILNYLSYPHKDKAFHTFDDVINTLKNGYNFDWKTCVLLCIISGEIKPGIIKYAKVEKIA